MSGNRGAPTSRGTGTRDVVGTIALAYGVGLALTAYHTEPASLTAWLAGSTLAVPAAGAAVLAGGRVLEAAARHRLLPAEAAAATLARVLTVAFAYAVMMLPGTLLHDLVLPAAPPADLVARAIGNAAVTLLVALPLLAFADALPVAHHLRALRSSTTRRRLLAGGVVSSLTGSLLVLPVITLGPAGQAVADATDCDATTQDRSYDVAAINVPLRYNRWGQGNEAAMIYALQQDKQALRDWYKPLDTTDSNRRLRPRPLVIRANEGECVAVRFTNELDVDQDEGLPSSPRVSMYVRGVPFDVQTSGGGHVGYNRDTTVGIGESITYYWKAPGEGLYFFNDGGIPAGGEADGGSLASGLYGGFAVEPKGSTWTDPVSGDALYSGTRDQSGELYIDAVVRQPDGFAFREAIQLAQDELPGTSTFGFNYGSEDTTQRIAERCADCVGEETSLSSWVYGDPALVKLASGLGPWKPGTPAGKENCGLGTPGFETDSCFTANVVHTYKGDPTKIRFGLAGVKETHVFHLHAHQWLAEDKDVGAAGRNPTRPGPGAKPESTTIDSQTFGPMEMFTADLLFGAGSNNGTVGDSIFHCHLYPHFAAGFWGLLRVHDVDEDGSGSTPDGVKVAALLPLPDRPSPDAPTAMNPGYPRFIPGQFGWRAPQPPMAITRNGVPEPRYVAGKKLQPGSAPLEVEQAVMDRMSGGRSKPGAPFNDACPVGAREVTYKVSAIQLKAVYNERGDFDSQARILVLDRDVDAVLSGRKKPEPLFARVNAGDCINWQLTNRLPNWFGNDAFLKKQQTNMFGEHIHLVKFDVMASDGATNGWNYQQAAFSAPQADFNDAIADAPGTCTEQSCRLDVPADVDPSTNSGMVPPGQTITERWYADYELRTVFTHDHHFAAVDQNRGQYGAVVVEPKGMDFRNPVTGTWYQPVNDPAHGTVCGDTCPGGAAGTAMDVVGPGAEDDFREFGLAIADFVSLTRGGGNPQNPEDVVNPPVAPESFPDDDPGTMAINYRNAPLELRRSKDGRPVDPAYAFSSHVFGDPSTPVLQTYDGDNVRMRVIQGSQEEQHVVQVHGVKWKREPDDPDSHYIGALPVGISEAFNFEVPRLGCDAGADCRGDYLYGSTSADDLWNGMWGILRVNGGKVPHLLPLPDNPQPGSVSVPTPSLDAVEAPARIGPGTPCPAGAPRRMFDVVALQTDIRYNDAGDHDPYGLVYALSEDEQAIRDGKNPEPLVLRAHEGDCIEVTLHNKLTRAFQEHRGVGDAHLPGLTGTLSPGLRVSLHPSLLKYDVRGSDGATVGYNGDQTVGPGESMLYRWYADDVTPGEVGAVNLTEYGDVLGHRHHGLFAGLIVEPRGTTWNDPVTGVPVRAGADADVRWPGHDDYRESTVFFQDGLNLRRADGSLIEDPEGHPPPPPGAPAEDVEPPDPGLDAEDTGEKAFNYRSEPFHNRLGFEPTAQVASAKAMADVYDSHTHGDPATPIVRAYEHDPLRMRILMGSDKPRQHAFGLAGHSFLTSPDDPGSRRIGTASGIGVNTAVNAEMGRTNTAGDYLFGCMVGFFHRSGGLWGLLRVYPTPSVGTALAPTGLAGPDDPSKGGHPVLPLELDTVEVSVFNDLDGDGTRGPGEPSLPDVPVSAGAGAGSGTKTDADGVAYLSTWPGSHRISAEAPAGLLAPGPVTVTSQGDNDVQRVSLPVAAARPTTAVVQAAVFDDLDRDGARDGNEPPMGGVGVSLSSGGIAAGSATSGPEGLAETTVTPGVHALSVRPPTGWTVVRAPATVSTGPAGSVSRVQVAVAASRPPVAAPRPVASLRVVVFADRDRDGRRDRGERAVRTATVTAMRAATLVARASTDARGVATLRVPAARSYALAVRAPAAFRPLRRAIGLTAGTAGTVRTRLVALVRR